jgi:putative transposase
MLDQILDLDTAINPSSKKKKKMPVVAPFAPEDPNRFYELARAMISTSEAQEMIRASGVKSFDGLVGGNGLIAQMLKPLMQELLNAEMTEHLGYPKHSTAGYLTGNSRNGSYSRTLRSSDGTVDLDIPRAREGGFRPAILDSYKQVSTELEQKIIFLYSIGTSNKDIVGFIKETYGADVSEGFISSVTNAVMGLAREWQSRSLQSIYTIAYLDAIHIKCREEGKVVNKAVHIIMAYDLEGRKEILGHYISSGGEGAKFWLTAITDLKSRGVTDILISCVDGLSGFEQAIHSVFPHTTVQRCVVHAIRNSMCYIPHKLKSRFMEYLKPVYTATNIEQAEASLTALEAEFSLKYPMATNIWRNNWEALSQYFQFSPEIRKMIYTTNPIESYNSIIRKYTNNRRSFVSNEAMQKVLYLATMKAQESWGKCVPNWPTILNQLSIHFNDRITMN